MREKIHSLLSYEDLDALKDGEIYEVIGFTYPEENGSWEVVGMMEGEGYTCDTQFEANVIANQEMIKAMLIRLLKEEMK